MMNYKAYETKIETEQILNAELTKKFNATTQSEEKIILAQYLEVENFIELVVDTILLNEITNFDNLISDENKKDVQLLFLDCFFSKNSITSFNDIKKNEEYIKNLYVENIRIAVINPILKEALIWLIDPLEITKIEEPNIQELGHFCDNELFLFQIFPVTIKNILLIKSQQAREEYLLNIYIEEYLKNHDKHKIFEQISLFTDGKILGLYNKKEKKFTSHSYIQQELIHLFKIKIVESDSSGFFVGFLDDPDKDEIEVQLYYRLNDVEVDLIEQEGSILENFKYELMAKMNTASSTIGKIISKPEVKIGIALVSALGVIENSWADELSKTPDFSESQIANILNKLEKVHLINGFEHGKTYKEIDGQLESIGLDLADIKLNSSMSHRSIKFFGENGDYTLNIGGSSVNFKVDEVSDQYRAYFKGDGIDRGIISDSEFKEWGDTIVKKLNKARMD